MFECDVSVDLLSTCKHTSVFWVRTYFIQLFKSQNAILNSSGTGINFKKIHFEYAINFEVIQKKIIVVSVIKFFCECIILDLNTNPMR